MVIEEQATHQASDLAKSIARMLLRAVWWLLKTVFGPSLPVVIAAFVLGLVAVALVLTYWQGVSGDRVLGLEAKDAVALAQPEAKSFDRAEEEQRLPWSLVAVVAKQGEEETKQGAGPREIARELAPRFSYQEITLQSEHRVVLPDGTENTVRSSRTVQVLAEADTFRGTYAYRYRVVRRTTADGYDEEPVRESVTYREDWGRLQTALGKFFGRQVQPWEVQWVVNMAADVGSGTAEPGQWLLAESPDGWWSGFDWKSTWTGSPGPEKVAPLEGPLVVTSPFGKRIHPVYGTEDFHTGVDLAADLGTPVRAVQAGLVQHAGPAGGYGLAVILDHGGGIHTVYAHLSALAVEAGQEVAAGQVIGEVGSTGVSTGPHLHFEVRKGDEPVDPLQWLGG